MGFITSAARMQNCLAENSYIQRQTCPAKTLSDGKVAVSGGQTGFFLLTFTNYEAFPSKQTS